mmetsp:Transcript_30479/g.73128  ORF Transcript_30479/g.73128 Transcript_30479/m.73128 type:complete len:100 (+) Transcript_30479:79-378(+)
MTAKLNANATSFTPSVPAMPGRIDDSENGTASSDVNAQMNDTGMANPAPTNAALPPHMKKHAAEFWFPQSRDCACCNGYKHGCACQASNNGTCASCANL